MMQNFNAECTVNLHVEPMAKSHRFIWVCSMYYLGKRVLVTKAFSRLPTREGAELSALRYGLQQALRLKQEKLDLCCAFGDWLSQDRVRDKDLHLLLEETQSLWNDFRLKRCVSLSAQEKDFLQQSARTLFFKKKEGSL